MSDVHIVRKPLRVRERSMPSRSPLDQRIRIRFPWIAHASAPLFGRLSPSSRVRQALLWRGVRLGLEALTKLATVWVLRHGRVIRLQAYWNHAEALEAAGLRE
jgi:hypothetical protein